MSAPCETKRACDQCHTFKEKCRRPNITVPCERCARLNHTCHTTRLYVRPGRKPRGTKTVGYTLPSSSVEAHSNRLVPTNRCTPPHSDTHVFFDSRVYNYIPSNPTQFPELDVWEKYFFNLMKDISAPSPLDKYLIGPSFHEIHHRSFVQYLLQAPPILKDAIVACAAVLLGDQYSQHEGLGLQIANRRGASAVSSLSCLKVNDLDDLAIALILGVAMATFAMHVEDGQPILIAHYTLNLIKPTAVYRAFSGSGADSEMMDFLLCLITTETCECLLRSEKPTIRIEAKTTGHIDRYIGLSGSLLALLYDICEVSHLLRHSDEAAHMKIMMRLDRIQILVEEWQPLTSANFLKRFTQPEVITMLAQAKILRLSALLIIHRLRHPFGQCDQEAIQMSKSILEEFGMVIKSTGRSIPCTGVACQAACFEIIDLEERRAMLAMSQSVIKFSKQSVAVFKAYLISVWAARDCGTQFYWFNIADYTDRMGKLKS